jgi:hypothetical protein
MNINLDFDFVEKKTAHSKQVLPYMRLWWAVLLQAVNDVTHATTEDMDRKVLLDWFNSDRQDVCSFIWICDTLDLNYEYIRGNVRRINKTFLDNEEMLRNYVVKDHTRRNMIRLGKAKLQIIDGKVKFITKDKK